MSKEKQAIDLIRSYETSMGDSWRNDFCDSEEDSVQMDENRLNSLLEDIENTLDISEIEAYAFYQKYRWD